MNNFTLDRTLQNDCFEVAEFSLCNLLMMNDQQYPWFILVPRVANITEIFQLSEKQLLHFNQESNGLGKCLMDFFNGDKLNVAALGNVVSQLHIHHIVRFKHDPCWPKPVWGTLPTIPFDTQVAEQRITLLREAIELSPYFYNH